MTCNGQSDGSIDITISGGTLPYSYDWDNDGTFDFDDGEDLENLSGGTYNVVVRDVNGCETTGTYIVGEPTELIIEGEPLILDVSCNGLNDGSIDITVNGGTLTYSYDWSNDGTGDLMIRRI